MSRLVLLIFIGYLVFNYNKKCVVQIYPQLIEEFGFSKHDVGFVSSSQQLAISLFTFFGGFLTDYIASSLLFPLGIISCGLTALIFPLGSSVNYFAFVWFLNGLGHGLELPTAMRLTKQFTTLDTYSTSWSLVLTAINVSGVLNPLITPFLALRLGWRISIFISGLITLTSGLVIFYILNLAPHNSPTVVKKRKTKAKELKKSSGLEYLLFAVVGVAMLNRFTISFGRLSVSDWTQMFFISEKNMSASNAGLFVSIYEFVSIFGKLASGRLNDYLVRRFYPRFDTLTIRLPLAIVLHILNVLSLWLYIYWIDSSSSVTWLISVAILVGVFSSANVLTMSVLSSEVGNGRHEGFINSLCNLAAKLGGLCSGYPFTLIAFWFDWNTSFMSLILMALLATLADCLVLAAVSRSNSKTITKTTSKKKIN